MFIKLGRVYYLTGYVTAHVHMYQGYCQKVSEWVSVKIKAYISCGSNWHRPHQRKKENGGNATITWF